MRHRTENKDRTKNKLRRDIEPKRKGATEPRIK